MHITFRCDPSLIELLPAPVLAKNALPDWLRKMTPLADSAVHLRRIRTVKQCPPFVDAMTHGFMILLPCDVSVQDGQFSWDWPLTALQLNSHPRAPLSFHVAEQIAGTPLARGSQSAIKFNSFWTIELPDGWSLMATHPINHDDLPFRLVTGMVDSDRFSDVGINFPAVWTKPDFVGVLKRGTPIAQCYPVLREPLTLICETMSDEHISRHDALSAKIMGGPGVYRKSYRSKRKP